MPAALWGAEMMYAACQCLAFREIDEAELTRRLSRPFSGRPDASAHYSVDLTFRMLPDLYHRARSASRNDPLVARLQEWAEDWPLSSVGMPEATRENLPANPKRIDAILEDPSPSACMSTASWLAMIAVGWAIPAFASWCSGRLASMRSWRRTCLQRRTR